MQQQSTGGEREHLAAIDPALGRGTRLPLPAVLLGVVLVVALAPLALFSLLTTREMKEALVTAQLERQLHLSTSVAQQLDGFLEHVGRESVKISEALAAFSNADQGTAPYLGEFLDDTVVLARFRPLHGTASAALKPDFRLPPALDRELAADQQSLLEPALAQGRAVERGVLLRGPFALGPERTLAVIISTPVERHGAMLGVYQEVAVLGHAWTEAASAVPPPMRLMLLRPDGTMAAGSASAVSEETPDTVRRREIVQQFLGSRGRSSGARAYEAVSRAGQPRRLLGSYAATRQGWGVFVEVDETLALAPVERMGRLVTYGGALAVTLALAAALLLGMLISRPITRLAAISKRLADGDFSVEARASRVAEVDVLALNFNRMAARLGELVERFRAAAREANDMFLGTIRALAEAIDEKDPYTKGHSVRVNRYAVIIGRYLGLSREEMRNLQISSLLHDVGKIGIDDAILKKPAALSPEEFQVMKTHPERGAKIMGRIPQMKNIIPGMRFHHERWVGGGYPLGLSKDEIPLQARIISVADTFDAMITDRPYQKAMTIADAVARINDLKGKQLDPQVVDAFNRAYEAGEFDDAVAARPARAADQGAAHGAGAGAGAGSGPGSAPGPASLAIAAAEPAPARAAVARPAHVSAARTAPVSTAAAPAAGAQATTLAVEVVSARSAGAPTTAASPAQTTEGAIDSCLAQVFTTTATPTRK